MVRNKIVRFIVPIITCCLLVVVCAVPAMALTSFPDDVNYRPFVYQTVTTGNITAYYVDIDNYQEGSYFCFNQPIDNVVIEGDYNVLSGNFNGFLGQSQNPAYPMKPVFQTRVIDAVFEGYGISNNKRMMIDYDFGINESNDPSFYTVEKFVIDLDPFSLPIFNANTMLGLQKSFGLQGAGGFYTQISIKHVTRDGVVTSFNYTTPTYSIGGQNQETGAVNSGSSLLFTWDDMLNINALFQGNYNGGTILIDSLKVVYNPVFGEMYSLNDRVRLSMFCFPLENSSFSGPYPLAYYDAEKFYTTNNIIYTTQQASGGGSGSGGTGTGSVGNTVSNFIGGALDGVFEVEIGHGISLGGVIITVIAVAIMIWILKLFAGG